MLLHAGEVDHTHTAAERAWAATEESVNETGLRLKSIEKQTGTLKSMLAVMDGESRSQF